MTLWTSYFRWFEENYDAIKNDFFKEGAIECNGGPQLNPTDPHHPKSAPWRVDWAMVFPDGKYFRVKECFKRLQHPHVGKGEREHFSFHYGTAHAELDHRGFPKTAPSENPPCADLRIDIHNDNKNRLTPHIHVGTKEHIYQERVEGFVIETADMFAFLEAVREHRKTKRPIIEIMNIRVLD